MPVAISSSPSARDHLTEFPILANLFHWQENGTKRSPISDVLILSNGKKEVSDDSDDVEIIKKLPVAPKPKQEDLDLTGSPLKASFTLEDDDDNDDFEAITVVKRVKGPSFHPLDTITARKFISYDTTKNLPVFAVCSNDNTLYLGKLISETTSTMYKIVYNDKTSSNDDIETALKDHLDYFKFEPEVTTQTSARAIFNLSDPMGEPDPDRSNVKLRLKWPKPKFFRENPPESSSTVELLVDICFNDERSSCKSLLDDLKLLKNFKSGLQNKGIKWRKKDDDEKLNIMDELQELLIEVKQQGPRPLRKTSHQLKKPADQLSEDLETLTIKEREDFDLTDKIWNVLKKVDSFAQLCDSWKYLFQMIKGDDIKPYISARNTTRVANVFRSVVRGEVVSETILNGSAPLELLYEIGIEKLQRDYSYPILFNLLATRDDLEGILQDSDKIFMLEKLHCIQEIICLCQSYLSPNTSCLRVIILQAIETLSKWKTVPQKPKFVFNISGSHVKDQLSMANPVVWQCQFFTHGSKIDIETSFQFSLECPADVIRIEDVEDNDDVTEGNIEKATTYYEIKAEAVTRPAFKMKK